MLPFHTVRWSPAGDAVRIVDQTRLPDELVERDLRTTRELCDAIARLEVRGAPAIGVAAAMGLAVSLRRYGDRDVRALRDLLVEHAARIRAVRPTAVNLGWAMDRMLRRAADEEGDTAALLAALHDEAERVLDEDRAMCDAIGRHGLPLLPEGARVLTVCNAGALATAGIGTALAPIYLAHARGRRVSVTACETRPLLQGSRLTAWELARAGVSVRVIADGMAASLMAAGEVDLVITGADRIARNGDVANKIGTYALAVLARHHGIPFYVAAPTSTLDPATPHGGVIPIEERDADEIRRGFGRATAPGRVPVWNPAFDVTPAALVTAIVTDAGVQLPPYAFTGVKGA